MNEINLLKQITNKKIINEIFSYCPRKLTLKLVKKSKLLQDCLSISKYIYFINNQLKKKKVIKFTRNEVKFPIKELILSSLQLTNNENCYQSKEKNIKLNAHTDSINSILELPNNIIATASKDTKIKLWDLKQLKCVSTLSGHTEGILILIKLINDNILSASFKNELLLWNSDNDDYSLKKLNRLNNTSGLIHVIQLKNEQLAISHWDLTLELYDLNRNETIFEIKEHSQPIIQIAQLACGNLLTFSRDQTVKQWNTQQLFKLQCVNTIPLESSDDIHKYVTSFLENQLSSRIVLGYSNGSLIIANSLFTKSFGCVKYHNNPITSIIQLSNSHNCACIAFNEDIILIIDTINTEKRVIINTRENFDYKFIQLNNNRLLAGIKNGYIKCIGVNSDEFEMKLTKGDIIFKKLKEH